MPCKEVGRVPPRTHNLGRLAEIAAIELSHEQLDLCGHLMEYHIGGRYPEEDIEEPSDARARAMVREAQDFIEWLMQKL